MVGGRKRIRTRLVTLLLSGGALAAGCSLQPLVEDCADKREVATINVAGVFRYAGNGANAETGGSFNLSGTITFEQQDSMVRVTDTTYDSGGLRRLESEFADLDGNELLLNLTPINGDTDYEATIRFVFSEDGNEFCVGFTDTNSDQGALGSFTGVRRSQ
ncbi:MAG: hypothetical protein IH987_11095 [Planctomycetes bacterium]|nr:hypothetical protein [Planctomycetota bacterium]